MSQKPQVSEGAKTDEGKKSLSFKRALPILLVICGAITAMVFFGKYLSFSTLQKHQHTLEQWRDANLLLALFAYAVIYIVIVTFSVPGATWLSITGGFLFGLYWATLTTVISATIGATLIFFAAKTGLGDALLARAGPAVKKMEAGINKNQVSYLLIMRLVPIVPFFVANIAPAFLGVRPITYIWTTLVGIIPGTAVYVSVGDGLSGILAQGKTPDISIIWSWHILGPLLALAALASLPILIKAFKKKETSS